MIDPFSNLLGGNDNFLRCFSIEGAIGPLDVFIVILFYEWMYQEVRLILTLPPPPYPALPSTTLLPPNDSMVPLPSN